MKIVRVLGISIFLAAWILLGVMGVYSLSPVEGALASLAAEDEGITGLALSPGYTQTVEAGTVITYWHVLTNTGSVTGTALLSASTSRGWPLEYLFPPYAGGTTLVMPFPLPPNRAMTIGLRLAVPMTAYGQVNVTALTATLKVSDTVSATSVVRDVTIVEPYTLYLPLVMRSWKWWYAYDAYEPNDSPSLAYGPLLPGRVYSATMPVPEDKDDYYFITPPDLGAAVTVTLHFPDGWFDQAGADYDLYVYVWRDGGYEQIGYSNKADADEMVTFRSEDKEYFIRVYAFEGYSQDWRYELSVAYASP